ncbi:MAG: alpha/beta hydrolase [bacterium]|jgi:pimeloyl-ACP methyl ester carboxylesterase
MKGEFARVITEDGLELQGLFVTPEGGASRSTVVHTHGLDGNFYENRFIDHIGHACVEAGFNFITSNNRGHDYISDFIVEAPGSGEFSYRQIGGIYEVFEESALDIAAWVDFAKSRGSTRIVIQGHSHGALKAVYYFTRGDLAGVEGLVLLSPSDDFGKQRAALGDEFGTALGLAEGLIKEGRELDLLPPGIFHYPISARSYHDIFRSGSPLGLFNVSRTDRNEFPELSSVRVPVLMIVGSVEEAFLGDPDDFIKAARELMPNAPGFEGTVLYGAPHNYLGSDAEAGRAIGAWLKANFS